MMIPECRSGKNETTGCFGTWGFPHFIILIKPNFGFIFLQE